MAPRHARYGPQDRYPTPPPAGFCISVFAVLRKGRKVLVGTPAPHARWTDDWIPQFRIYPKEDLEQAWRTPRLPGAYLREGEHPDAALECVVKEQLGMRRFKASKPAISSWTTPSDWYPGSQHWDLVFTYNVQGALPRAHGPWWSALEWHDPAKLKAEDFGWNSDHMRALKLAR